MIKIVSYLYRLLTFHISISWKPKYLFHYSNTKTTETYDQPIYIDPNFSNKEKKLILEAINNLNFFLNNHIVFTASDNSPCKLIKTNSKDESIKMDLSKYKFKVLGLCRYEDECNRKIYLLADNLDSDKKWKTTIIHELLHAIWLGHVESDSVMHKYNKGYMYPNKFDAQELINVWGDIELKDLNYFKN